MNRTFSIILIVIAIALIAYNTTHIDFANPFQGNSTIALIGILAPLCAIVLILIYTLSKKVEKELEEG